MTGSPPNTVETRAPAKVNLFLRVLGRRDDGYHELETLVAPISLADVLRIHAFADSEQFSTLSLSLEIEGDASLVRRVPADESNLVIKAAAALAERAAVKGFAEIELEKYVPVAAGLGGGSGDAAATLSALNELWGCGLDGPDLAALAASVGSDVPAMTMGGPALATGRGETIRSITVPSMQLLLVPQSFTVRTRDAFTWWDDDGGPIGPDRRPLVSAARAGDVAALGPLVYNDLEDPVTRRHPEVGDARKWLLDGGATGVVMCGSGPTVAGLFAEGHPLPTGIEGAIEVRTLAGPPRLERGFPGPKPGVTTDWTRGQSSV